MNKIAKNYAFAILLIMAAVFSLIKFSADKPKIYQYVVYYNAAEQHEDNMQWRAARSSWLMAKANADAISQTTNEANGRQAYCDYRIGMTYDKEGIKHLAIANLKLALETQAADIDCFTGKNGAAGIREDLIMIVESANKD